MNEKGHLCIGRECIVAEATPEGLRFRLDPDTCDPKTREAFVNAMLKGTRILYLRKPPLFRNTEIDCVR